MSDFWVGIFVFLGIIAIVFLSFRVGSYNSFDKKNAYSLVAKFENLGGLKEGSPVKASGVTIGRVMSINFDSTHYKAKVKIYIDNSVKFPIDSSISVLTSGLLGEQYLGIESGGDDLFMVDGEEFILTQSAMVLEKVLGQFLYSKAAENND
jgi:phospholipid/cholesterol/gamma-HCH transport system substrate-binding protein